MLGVVGPRALWVLTPYWLNPFYCLVPHRTWTIRTTGIVIAEKKRYLTMWPYWCRWRRTTQPSHCQLYAACPTLLFLLCRSRATLLCPSRFHAMPLYHPTRHTPKPAGEYLTHTSTMTATAVVKLTVCDIKLIP